jgi:hypothetical protein
MIAEAVEKGIIKSMCAMLPAARPLRETLFAASGEVRAVPPGKLGSTAGRWVRRRLPG